MSINLNTLPDDVIGTILDVETIHLHDYLRYRCVSKQIQHALSRRIASLQPNPNLPDGVYDSISVDIVMSLPNLSLLNSRYAIMIQSEDQLTRLGSHPSLHRAILNIKSARVSHHRAVSIFMESYLKIKGRKKFKSANGYSFVFGFGSSKETFIRFSETDLYLSGYPFAVQQEMNDLVSTLQFQSKLRIYGGEIDFNLEMIPCLPQLKVVKLRIPDRIIFLNDHHDLANVQSDADYSFHHLFSSRIVAYRCLDLTLHEDIRSCSYYLMWIRLLLDRLDGLTFPHVKIFFPIPIQDGMADRMRKIFPHLRKIHLAIHHESDLLLISQFLFYPGIVLLIEKGSRFEHSIPKYLHEHNLSKDKIRVELV